LDNLLGEPNRRGHATALAENPATFDLTARSAKHSPDFALIGSSAGLQNNAEFCRLGLKASGEHKKTLLSDG
jgi:hypothetical protein